MQKRYLFPLLVLLISAGPATKPEIDWKPYSDEVFAQAKREHKLVILDLHAVWCHWCHVMDKETYSDPTIESLINQNFLAIGVDQDSRPDISNKYENYGWPATIIFDSDGHEIVKRRGYIPPKQMESLLKAVIADPTPGPSIEPVAEIHASTEPALTTAARTKLEATVMNSYDPLQDGWGRGFKFIDGNLIEYCSMRAMAGDKKAERMARLTLVAGLKIIDPAWGGVYQYSTDGDWLHPHFEKIMSHQTSDLQAYASAYSAWHDPQFLSAALKINHFLTTFLMSPEGAFYTSMDADRIPGEHAGEYFSLDDASRRRLGLPRIDTHIYARENGWAISSLVACSNFTGESQSLAAAIKAAHWNIKNRAFDGGGFRHDHHDVSGPYLGDSLAMGRAFLDLYIATADRRWLGLSSETANYIAQNFVSHNPKSPGVLTSVVQDKTVVRLDAEVDENVAVVRFARLLWAFTGKAEHLRLAETAMKFMAAPEIASTRGWMVGGLLLADRAMRTDAPHIVIVGPKSDRTAQALYDSVRRWPVGDKRLEWYDPAEGPLPHQDVEYPTTRSAAFVCAAGSCSAPIVNQNDLDKKLANLMHESGR